MQYNFKIQIYIHFIFSIIHNNILTNNEINNAEIN